MERSFLVGQMADDSLHQEYSQRGKFVFHVCTKKSSCPPRQSDATWWLREAPVVTTWSKCLLLRQFPTEMEIPTSQVSASDCSLSSTLVINQRLLHSGSPTTNVVCCYSYLPSLQCIHGPARKRLIVQLSYWSTRQYLNASGGFHPTRKLTYHHHKDLFTLLLSITLPSQCLRWAHCSLIRIN